MTTLKIIGDRPTQTPEGQDIPAIYIIFNAPRPLWGQITWQGEFGHGIFYAALDPDDKYTGQGINENDSLDGWLCQWVTLADVLAWAKEYYARYDNIDIDRVSMPDIRQVWHEHCAVTK